MLLLSFSDCFIAIFMAYCAKVCKKFAIVISAEVEMKKCVFLSVDELHHRQLAYLTFSFTYLSDKTRIRIIIKRNYFFGIKTDLSPRRGRLTIQKKRIYIGV